MCYNMFIVNKGTSDEIFSNLVNYSNCSEIKVDIEISEELIKLVFKDNGKKFNPLEEVKEVNIKIKSCVDIPHSFFKLNSNQSITSSSIDFSLVIRSPKRFADFSVKEEKIIFLKKSVDKKRSVRYYNLAH